jgi:hypothetical protein
MTGQQHGTRKSFVAGCHCTPCRTANRAYENNRQRMILYGRWRPYVDAGPAREHVRALREAGIGWKRVAELAGLSTSVVSKLLYGGPGDRPPAKRLRPETEAAILAVRPALDTFADSAPVDATGTHRRVQALVWCGWSQARICARIGMLRSNFGAVLEREQVTAATARAVRGLYDELWNQAPPESSHHEKAAASRARNYARARGWAPPAAWDDDEIDNPDASPAEGWQRTRGGLHGARLAAEAEEMTGLGVSLPLAADQLKVSVETLERALHRARRAAA